MQKHLIDALGAVAFMGILVLAYLIADMLTALIMR